MMNSRTLQVSLNLKAKNYWSNSSLLHLTMALIRKPKSTSCIIRVVSSVPAANTSQSLIRWVRKSWNVVSWKIKISYITSSNEQTQNSPSQWSFHQNRVNLQDRPRSKVNLKLRILMTWGVFRRLTLAWETSKSMEGSPQCLITGPGTLFAQYVGTKSHFILLVKSFLQGIKMVRQHLL